MQQRQPRLGDILDDYCPRERRLTNHAIVAMVGDAITQTRCTTCDAEHEYKHAKVPRLRPKTDASGAIGQASSVPRRVVPTSEPASAPENSQPDQMNESEPAVNDPEPAFAASALSSEPDASIADEDGIENPEEGPVHRRLIRATLPRSEGQPPPERPAPDFTIRQPGGRNNRFRGRHARGGGQFSQGRGNTNGNFGPPRGAGRQGQGRPQSPSRPGGRHGSGRKRSK